MANIFSKLVSKATFWDQADDHRIAREEEEERKRIIEQLSDSVFKLKEGEDQLTLAKLKSLNATPKQIE